MPSKGCSPHKGSVEEEVVARWRQQAAVPGLAADWLDYCGVQDLRPPNLSAPKARDELPELHNDADFDHDLAELLRALLPPVRMQVRRLDRIVCGFWKASEGLQQFSRSTRGLRGGSMRAAEELIDEYEALRLEAHRAIRLGNVAVHAVLAKASRIRQQARVMEISSSGGYRPELDGVPDPLRTANAQVVAMCACWQRAVLQYCGASILHDHEFRAKFEAMLRLHRLLPRPTQAEGSWDQLPALVAWIRGSAPGGLFYRPEWAREDLVLDRFVGCEEVAAMKLLMVNKDLPAKAQMFRGGRGSPEHAAENASLVSEVECDEAWTGLIETDWTAKQFATVNIWRELGLR